MAVLFVDDASVTTMSKRNGSVAIRRDMTAFMPLADVYVVAARSL